MTERLIPDRERPGAWFVRVEGTDQSYVDPDDPLRLEFDYMQRIAEVLDLLAPPGERLRVLHVGGAGMSLARYVAATRPHSAQIVLEPDVELTEEVRRVAPLPPRSGIKVRPVDGLTGVAALAPGQLDVVIVDAFAGARVPAELSTLEWFEELNRVLRPEGTVIMNLTDRGPFPYARRVVAGLSRIGRDVSLTAEPHTLRGRRFGNVVLVASAGLPVEELNRLAARAVFPYRVLIGRDLASLVGAALPFTRADSEPSPEPPRGSFGGN